MMNSSISAFPSENQSNAQATDSFSVLIATMTNLSNRFDHHVDRMDQRLSDLESRLSSMRSENTTASETSSPNRTPSKIRKKDAPSARY
jgi:hypothetical protein